MSRTKIDDLDARISYQGPWLFVNMHGSNVPYKNTVAELRPNDREVNRINLTFNGTYVAVHGAIGRNDAGADHNRLPTLAHRYKIDGEAKWEDYITNATTELSFLNFGSTQLYMSPPLPPGEHTIQVEITNLVRTRYAFDFFEIEELDQTTETDVVVGPSTLSAGPPIGAIVGAVLGGVVLIISMIWLYFWWFRRKKTRRTEIAPFDSLQYATPDHEDHENGPRSAKMREVTMRDSPVMDIGPLPPATQSARSLQSDTESGSGIPLDPPQIIHAIRTLQVLLERQSASASGTESTPQPPPPSYQEAAPPEVRRHEQPS